MLTLAIAKPTRLPITNRSIPEYDKLKTSLKNSTATYGAAISATYFITQGADVGVSATIGAIASYTYMNLLSDHVDNIEKSTIQKQMFVPVSTAIFEVLWNNAPFAFDFDYGATFIGFLAYKFALTYVLFETIRDIIIEDNTIASEPREWETIDEDLRL
jgi:hypothetical protein